MAIASNYRTTSNNTNASVNSAVERNYLFSSLKNYHDLTSFNLMRGVPDFGSLMQFDPYETGYATLICCGMPDFLLQLARRNTEYEKLIKNWMHIVEYEFKTFDGLQDITTESMTIGDDLNSMQVINKVNMQPNMEFTLTYDEKSGTPLAKFSKLYLTGIKDARTQVKTYHGLLEDDPNYEPGFDKEVFTFFYIVTDNTMRNIEAAYLLIGCQLTSADLDMFNFTKGTIEKKETQLKFTGYPITSTTINACAKEMMDFLLSADAGLQQIKVDSDNFDYAGVHKIRDTLTSYTATNSSILSKYPNINKLTDKYSRSTSVNAEVMAATKDPKTSVANINTTSNIIH